MAKLLCAFGFSKQAGVVRTTSMHFTEYIQGINIKDQVLSNLRVSTAHPNLKGVFEKIKAETPLCTRINDTDFYQYETPVPFMAGFPTIDINDMVTYREGRDFRDLPFKTQATLMAFIGLKFFSCDQRTFYVLHSDLYFIKWLECKRAIIKKEKAHRKLTGKIIDCGQSFIEYPTLEIKPPHIDIVKAEIFFVCLTGSSAPNDIASRIYVRSLSTGDTHIQEPFIHVKTADPSEVNAVITETITELGMTLFPNDAFKVCDACHINNPDMRPHNYGFCRKNLWQGLTCIKEHLTDGKFQHVVILHCSHQPNWWPKEDPYKLEAVPIHEFFYLLDNTNPKGQKIRPSGLRTMLGYTMDHALKAAFFL